MSVLRKYGKAGERFLPARWMAVTLLESAVASLVMARLAFGPLSVTDHASLWLIGAGSFAGVYLIMALWIASWVPARRAGPRGDSVLMAGLSLPFLAFFALSGVVIAVRQGVVDWLLQYSSSIQPFPAVAMGILILLVLLLKALIISVMSSRENSQVADMWDQTASFAAPAGMLLVGILQASVYIIPIGNAFLRFWAIADAVTLGAVYPVTLTEDGPISAGSPPYVYDLALFPLLLQASFAVFGHNSLAGHIPAAVAGALFPLSLYLLLAEATGSRVTALVFGMIASLFPYFRFWVLNLPDPDALLLTSSCFAGYFYLRALAWPEHTRRWIVAGVAAGVLSLARPEGILYAGCLALAALVTRPGLKRLGAYFAILAAFVVPMAFVWVQNFGFLWPQNYNKTLHLDYPIHNLEILNGTGALRFYQQGLGLDEQGALAVLVLFCGSVLFGTTLIVFKNWRLLPMVIPGIGNTVLIFFANPYIPNTFHFADFFRHDAFGIPFLILASAFGFQQARLFMARRAPLRPVAYLGLLLLVAVVVREGDIVANPTLTHRPGGTQVLTTFTHLSFDAIARNPMPLPMMEYQWNEEVNVARLDSVKWPDASFDFFAPLNMAFDSEGRPFGYASVAAFLLVLFFALMAEASPARIGPRRQVTNPRNWRAKR